MLMRTVNWFWVCRSWSLEIVVFYLVWNRFAGTSLGKASACVCPCAYACAFGLSFGVLMS